MMFGRNLGSALVAARLPVESVGVEIGVWRGDSTELFLRRAAHVHLVDPWAPEPYRESDEYGGWDAYLARYAALTGGADPEAFRRYYDDMHALVLARFPPWRATIHRQTSTEFLRAFEQRVDWVYVDGLHSFEGCLADLRGARRIVRERGVIYGDDYGRKPGVTAAVRAFAAETGLRFEELGKEQYAFVL
jgi:hypothetical protein